MKLFAKSQPSFKQITHTIFYAFNPKLMNASSTSVINTSSLTLSMLRLNYALCLQLFVTDHIPMQKKKKFLKNGRKRHFFLGKSARECRGKKTQRNGERKEDG